MLHKSTIELSNQISYETEWQNTIYKFIQQSTSGEKKNKYYGPLISLMPTLSNKNVFDEANEFFLLFHKYLLTAVKNCTIQHNIIHIIIGPTQTYFLLQECKYIQFIVR